MCAVNGIAQIALVAALIAAYVLLFSPSITKLNTVLRNSRATLLQFPEEVISGVPAIRALVKELAKVSRQQE